MEESIRMTCLFININHGSMNFFMMEDEVMERRCHAFPMWQGRQGTFTEEQRKQSWRQNREISEDYCYVRRMQPKTLRIKGGYLKEFIEGDAVVITMYPCGIKSKNFENNLYRVKNQESCETTLNSKGWTTRCTSWWQHRGNFLDVMMRMLYREYPGRGSNYKEYMTMWLTPF